MTAGRGRRAALRLVGLAVAAAAIGGLVVGAVDGARSAATQANADHVAQANVDDAYYRCLTAQAHSLVSPGRTVAISLADLGDWVTLSKAVAPWAVLTLDGHEAVAVLSLRSAHGPGSCLGSVVVAHYPDGAVRRGTGGSLPGREQPPPTPL